MKKFLLITLAVVLFCSCSSSVKVLKPTGENARVTMRSSQIYNVELLAISDSLLYVSDGMTLAVANLSVVNSVFIPDYRINPALKLLASIPSLGFELLVTIGAFGAEYPVLGTAAIIAMVATIYAFAADDPKANFSSPAKKREIEKFRLYCRYPQNLSAEGWKQLLQYYHQDDFIRLTN
jgi:hypothetical protein